MGNCIELEKEPVCYLCDEKITHRSYLFCKDCKKVYHYSCLYQKNAYLNNCFICQSEHIETVILKSII